MTKKTTLPPLIDENIIAFVDTETHLICYTFRGHVTMSVFESVLIWSRQIMTSFRAEDYRGSFFDFRQVTSFEIGTISVALYAQKETARMLDLNAYPFAYVVSSADLEAKIRAYVSVGEGGGQMVHKSMRQALAAVNSWNEQHGRLFDLPEDKMNIWPQKYTFNDDN